MRHELDLSNKVNNQPNNLDKVNTRSNKLNNVNIRQASLNMSNNSVLSG